MRIIVATGIYPPAIGGPAQYARNLETEFTKLGHETRVLTYKLENYLPSGVRHLYFFIKIFFTSFIFNPDFILALDTFSVAWPAVLVAKLLNKKIIIRTGGDFLWEGYVERTGDLVLLREFYHKIKSGEIRLNLKETIISKLTIWTLKNCSQLVFSTPWQREIWRDFYELNLVQCKIIENYYGEKLPTEESKQKNFIAATRKLKWKNLEKLQNAFRTVEKIAPEISLDLASQKYDQFLEKLKSAYAVILVSLGDISPNLVLDALRFNKPVILTQETGLRERLGEAVIWVNPESEQDITSRINWLVDSENYQQAIKQAQNFNFTHGWQEIAGEFLTLAR